MSSSKQSIFDILNRGSSETVRYAITFGEDGAFPIHELPDINGFSSDELHTFKQNLEKHHDLICDIIDLHTNLIEPYASLPECMASVLIIRNLIGTEGANQMLLEQRKLKYNCIPQYSTQNLKKTKLIMTRSSRSTLHFSESNTKSSISISDVPFLNEFRNKLPLFFGKKALNLNPKANCYHAQYGGIGYHGDSERNRVICLTLGASMTLRYHWRLPNSIQHELKPNDIILRHGDVYIMSEKATGSDWKDLNIPRVVHAAGNAQYIGKSNSSLKT